MRHHPGKLLTSQIIHEGRASLADEFRYIEEGLLEVPSGRPRFRGGESAWTELENWLKVEGLLG